MPCRKDAYAHEIAETAEQQAVERFGRLDTLVNNAGLMLLGPSPAQTPGVGPHDRHQRPWPALHHPRRVADIVNIRSIAGRVAWNGYGVYNFTKFGVNGFTESLRQEVTQRHVRVGVIEPGGVATELGSHNKPEVRNKMIDPFYEQTEVLVSGEPARLEDSPLTVGSHTVMVSAGRHPENNAGAMSLMSHRLSPRDR